MFKFVLIIMTPLHELCENLFQGLHSTFLNLVT